MKARLEFDQDRSLLTVSFHEGFRRRGAPLIPDAAYDLAGEASVDRALLDFTGLTGDVGLNEMVDVRKDFNRFLEHFGAAKIAAATKGGRVFTLQVLSLIFVEGVRVGVFQNLHDAVGWLLIESADERLVGAEPLRQVRPVD